MTRPTDRFMTAILGLAAAAFALPALAGECPADKVGRDLTKPVTSPAKDVTDTVLTKIELAQEPVGLKDHELRLRKLVVQPGGVVPWHSHGDRPAIIYIVEGSITEYASTCAVPILHKAGEVARVTSATAHWWKNTGSKPVTLLSADILHDKTDANM
jgi:quercetin dioxygenase-like cupin family protein